MTSHLIHPLHRRLAVAGLAGALLLGGCASAPRADGSAASADVAATVPAGYGRTPAGTQSAASADSSAASPWWRHFDDAQLGALIDTALARNLDIALARERVRQVRAVRDQAAASGALQLGSGASVARSRNQAGSANAYQLGLDASWEPDFFGQLSSTQRGAELDVAASQATLAATRQSIAAEVALAYLQLRGSQRQLAIARRSLASQEQTLALAGWRAQAGLVSTLDAEQARASTEQTRASLPALQASVQTSAHALGVLLGQAPGTLLAQLGEREQVPQLTAPLPLGVPADLLRRRPDLQAAELTLRAELARLDSARAARWPGVTFSGSLALQAATLAGLSSSGAWLATLGAAIDWPLLDGGSRNAKIAQQDAVQAQARISYQAALLTALQDVEDALAYVESTRAQSEALERAMQAARNAQLLAEHRYRSGLIDFGTLQNTQQSLLSLENSLASAQTQYSLYLVRLGKALGGDWSADSAATSPTEATTAQDTTR